MAVSLKHAGGEIDLGEIARLAQIRAELPRRLAELAEADPPRALALIRAWGRGEKPVEQIWEEAV